MDIDYCDCCQEVKELKYCEKTDVYHCLECQDGHEVYIEYNL